MNYVPKCARTNSLFGRAKRRKLTMDYLTKMFSLPNGRIGELISISYSNRDDYREISATFRFTDGEVGIYSLTIPEHLEGFKLQKATR